MLGPLLGTCATDWHLYNNHCYFMSTVRRSWQDARDDCVAKGAKLTSITDEAEMEFIKEKS